MITRRNFLKSTAIGSAALFCPSFHASFGQNPSFPVERITDGAHFSWFGYYDKWQVDVSGRYVLGCRVDFEHRTPTGTDTLRIGVIDLQNNNRWKEIGTSNAWGWQQGCMLQWIPGSSEEVIWNDRVNNKFVSHVVNIANGKKRTLPKAIYALAPNGKFAIGTEFNRIQNLRPGYGYAGINDPHAAVKAPQEIGLYKMDLETGKSQLLISIADIAHLPHNGESVADNWHWFNHLLVSPDSSRLLFLHRWRKEITSRQEMAGKGFITRMITADTDGKDKYVIDPSGFSSHFIWQGSTHVFVWTKPIGKDWGFWLLPDKTQNSELIGGETMTRNGHNTYVPNTNYEWVLNDTYPDEERKQTLYLYHIPSKRQVILGRFFSPETYKGEWRCDLHPRCNQQGTKVLFDSTHEGKGRQMYMVDISRIIA